MIEKAAVIFFTGVAISWLYFVALGVKYFFETREIKRRLAVLDLTDKAEADRLRSLESSGESLLFLRRDGGLIARPYSASW